MEGYDIILQAGQSNADGYGHGPAANPYVPDERILYYTAGTPDAADYHPPEDAAVVVADERPNPSGGEEDRLGDFSLSFAKAYVEQGLLKEGRKLLIVRTAVGASGFLKAYWRVGDPLYQRMLCLLDRALELHPGNRLVAMLWHQGEHEAAFGNDPQRYREQLQAVVESLREHAASPALPFVCGGFCDQWAQKNQPACDNVMEAIRFAADAVGGAYVETADLRSNDQKTGDGDEIHFCREDLQELGRRYFEAFTRLIQ